MTTPPAPRSWCGGRRLDALENGEHRLRDLARRLGWKVARVAVENDMVNGKPKLASAFKRRKVANQRVVVDRLCTVTILPTARRGCGFDPTSVSVAPKRRLGTPS